MNVTTRISKHYTRIL